MSNVLCLLEEYPFIGLFFATLFGAILAETFSMNASQDMGAIRFLKNFFPKKSKTWYFRCNAIVTVLVGTLLVLVIQNPANIKEAFIAGMTWCGSLQTLALVQKEKSSK